MKKLILPILGTILVCLIGVNIFLSPKPQTYPPTSFVEVVQDAQISADALNIPLEFDKKLSDVNWDSIKAKSIYAFNPVSGQLYVSRDINTQRPIASITKLMTALVAYNEYGLNKQIQITKPIAISEGLLGLKVGDRITSRELMKASLIGSKNDAAFALSLPLSSFISKMNSTADVLGMTNTNFSNTNGLVNTNNYSTAKDLGILSSVIIRNEDLVGMTSSRSAVIHITGANKRNVVVNTTNKLLTSNKYLLGLKTGFTYQSGECLILYYKFSETDQLITIVLNSPDRFGESQKMQEMIEVAYDLE